MALATVTPAMRRKAEQLAELVPMLPRGRSKANGQGFVIVPSSTKPLTVAHYSSPLGCTCSGFKNRGVCAHQQACLIVLQRDEAVRFAAAQPAPARSAQQIYAEAGPFGPCIVKTCAEPAGGRSRRCGAHLDQLVATLGA